MERYFSQINYYPNNWFSTDWRLTHAPERDFTEMRIGANYTNKRFRTSPFVEIDSDDELLMGINLNFNLIDTPFARKPFVTSDNTIGRGLVSSFVFHDKNGNYIYDESDEPLPEVTVKSINVKRRADTNENGYSLLNRLPITRATDIDLDHDTLPDPYMISAAQGASIMPAAGEIVDLEFPVHMSGEVDGTVSIRDKSGAIEPLKRANVTFYPLTKNLPQAITATTAVDGFYVASQLPPGKYLATVSDKTAQKTGAGLSSPKIVDIGYDGNIVYGLNFELDKKLIHIPVEVIYDEALGQEVQYVLHVRTQPKTKLLSLLKQDSPLNTNIFKDLKKIDDAPDGTQRYGLLFNDLKKSYKKCRDLSENANPCALKIYMPATDMQLAGDVN